jgi:hypothetical protein
MGLRLAQNLSPLSASEGSAFCAVFCLAQPKRKQILRRSAPYNDTMTDTARSGVRGFTLRDFLGAGCSDLVVAAPCWVLLL